MNKQTSLERSERIAVLLSKGERDELAEAATKLGVGISTYIRIKALESCREVRDRAS